VVQNGGINIDAAREFAGEFGPDKLVLPSTLAASGCYSRLKESTEVTPTQMIAALDSFCGAFLYTHIDSEGFMAGLPLDPVRKLRKVTNKQLIVAGGIATHQEILSLHRMQVDAVVGMSRYSGLLKLPDSIPVAK
jgi:phosphoribosylformimino-5-aminoimidazole carboxamide ribotide isomerase